MLAFIAFTLTFYGTNRKKADHKTTKNCRKNYNPFKNQCYITGKISLFFSTELSLVKNRVKLLKSKSNGSFFNFYLVSKRKRKQLKSKIINC